MSEHTVAPPISTLDPCDAERVDWDAVVIGAGLSGSVAARGLALRGHRVLLVERTAFPRSKVCGCCLGRLGRAALDSIGLPDLLSDCGARPLEEVRLHAGGRPARVPLREVVGVSREALDQGLAREAIVAGAELLLGTMADPAPDGTVRLRVDGAERRLTARVVLHAGGLRAHQATDQRPEHARMVGFGAMAPATPVLARSGTVEMVIGHAGYVGVAPLEDGRVTIASALRSKFIRESGGARSVVERMLGDAGMGDLVTDRSIRFTGVPSLHRRRTSVEDGRLLAVGDAAGFVEPITGEGMSWALAGGAAVVPCADRAIREGTSNAGWSSTWRDLMRRRHRRCSLVGACTRHPRLVRAALLGSSLLPRLRAPLLSGLLGGAEPVPTGGAT